MRSLWIGVIAMLCTAAPAAAQPTAPARWGVDYGEHYCTLSRAAMGSAPVLIALRQVPGTERSELLAAGAPVEIAGFKSPDEATIRLMPSGTELKALIITHRNAKGDTVARFIGPSAEFVDQFAGSDELLIASGGKTRLQLPIPPAQAAVKAMRECLDKRMQDWGIDPKASSALRERPKPVNPAAVVQNEDYPREAVKNRESGLAVARLEISESGRVTGCTVVASTGSALLDSTTCELFSRRARYHPAIGPDGKPTAAAILAKFDWVLPD